MNHEQFGRLARKAVKAKEEARDLTRQSDGHDELAQDLRTLDPARWSTVAELYAEHEEVMWEIREGS